MSNPRDRIFIAQYLSEISHVSYSPLITHPSAQLKMSFVGEKADERHLDAKYSDEGAGLLEPVTHSRPKPKRSRNYYLLCFLSVASIWYAAHGFFRAYAGGPGHGKCSARRTGAVWDLDALNPSNGKFLHGKAAERLYL
jgi:hypothetical protein